MCHTIGFSPISTIGLGLMSVSSEMRVPSPPAKITTSYILIYYFCPNIHHAFFLNFSRLVNSCLLINFIQELPVQASVKVYNNKNFKSMHPSVFSKQLML